MGPGTGSVGFSGDIINLNPHVYHPVLKAYPGYFLSVCNTESHCSFHKPSGALFLKERK